MDICLTYFLFTIQGKNSLDFIVPTIFFLKVFLKEKFVHLKINITFYAASLNIRTLSNNHKKSLFSFINKSASKSIFF